MTSTGVLAGVLKDDIHSFKGIPYAAPPVGNLRWREPQPAASWTGSRRADAFGNACIQKPGLSDANGGNPGAISEDCLYLNVWTGDLNPTSRRPVVVWIHGGAYVFGSGSVPIYHGTPLAKQGAVFVSINYRMGPLGFFAHPALEKEQPAGAVNFGLLDQAAALKWVRANISKFGGDPDNVTIMGQSAGARSVLAHFASPLSRGLFHKGIALSSYVVPDASREKAALVSSNVATALGLAGRDATMADLRSVPADRFGQIWPKGASLGPVPIAGDTVLPRSIEDVFAAGGEAPVPLIIGNTSNDQSVVEAFGFDGEALVDRLGVAGLALRVLYPGVTDKKELARQSLNDAVFTFVTRWVADNHAKRARTWRYYFDFTARNFRPRPGAPHGAEISYFLDTLDMEPALAAKLTPLDRAYARTVSGYVLNFARSSAPVSTGAPQWLDDRFLFDRTMIFGNDRVEQRRRFMKVRLDVMLTLGLIAEKMFGD